MKIMFSAGEASGEIHGASLTRETKNLAPSVELCGISDDFFKRGKKINGAEGSAGFEDNVFSGCQSCARN